MFFRITFLIVSLVWPCTVIPQAFETPATSWLPRNSSTIKWMGPIITSEDKIVFSSGEVLELQLLVSEFSWAQLNQTRTEAYLLSDNAQLFSTTGIVENLQSGYPLCANGSINFLVAWKNPPDGISLEFFSGRDLPTTSAAINSCGIASFYDANWTFEPNDGQNLAENNATGTQLEPEDDQTLSDTHSSVLNPLIQQISEIGCPVYGEIAKTTMTLRQMNVPLRTARKSLTNSFDQALRESRASIASVDEDGLFLLLADIHDEMIEIIVENAYRVKVYKKKTHQDQMIQRFGNIVKDECVAHFLRKQSALTRRAPSTARNQYYKNADIVGADLTDNGIRDVSESKCESLCSERVGCRAYSYVVSKSWCWPKSGVTELVTRNGVNSGVVAVAPVVSSDAQQHKGRSEALGRSTDRSSNDLSDEECDAIAQIVQKVAGWRDSGMSSSAAQNQLSVAASQSNVSASTTSGIVSHVYEHSATSPTELYYQFKVACAIK